MGVPDREIGLGDMRPDVPLPPAPAERGLRSEEVDSEGGGAAEGTNSLPSISHKSCETCKKPGVSHSLSTRNGHRQGKR